MRTETVTIHSHDELSPEAQRRAVEREQRKRGEWGNPWTGEWQKCYSEIVEHFDLELDRRGEDVRNVRSEGIAELEGIRAWKYARREWGDLKECPWTGYYGDESFLAPLRKWIADPRSRRYWKTTSILDLLQDCWASFRKSWEDDDEHYMSDENVIEEFSELGYEFTEGGEFHGYAT